MFCVVLLRIDCAFYFYFIVMDRQYDMLAHAAWSTALFEGEAAKDAK